MNPSNPISRHDWLKQKRFEAEQRMDTLYAPIYDQSWGTIIEASHQRFIQRFLELIPPRSHLLDAACGTGKYWSVLLAAGHSILGIDQSQGMLDRANQKFPDVPTEKIGMQEVSYIDAFDSAVCMDSMEFVFPEDWPLVMTNFWRALKPDGILYFTVEITTPEDLQEAFAKSLEMGLPVVYGEHAIEGGYHYYPSMDQVRDWIKESYFSLLEEGEGDEYHHFIVRKRIAGTPG